jgi:hypothetical protein
MSILASLRAKRAELAEARRTLAGAKTLLADRKAQFDRENRELVLEINRANDAVAAAELMVRTLAVEHFHATSEKKPIAGVEVKIKKEYDVDEVRGFEWAKAKDLCLIPASLDIAAVKKLATVQALEFVTVRDVPSPQIATDLEKAIATEELTAPAADVPAADEPIAATASTIADKPLPF